MKTRTAVNSETPPTKGHTFTFEVSAHSVRTLCAQTGQYLSTESPNLIIGWLSKYAPGLLLGGGEGSVTSRYGAKFTASN